MVPASLSSVTERRVYRQDFTMTVVMLTAALVAAGDV
jgi:hypothetical protein